MRWWRSGRGASRKGADACDNVEKCTRERRRTGRRRRMRGGVGVAGGDWREVVSMVQSCAVELSGGQCALKSSWEGGELPIALGRTVSAWELLR